MESWLGHIASNTSLEDMSTLYLPIMQLRRWENNSPVTSIEKIEWSFRSSPSRLTYFRSSRPNDGVETRPVIKENCALTYLATVFSWAETYNETPEQSRQRSTKNDEQKRDMSVVDDTAAATEKKSRQKKIQRKRPETDETDVYAWSTSKGGKPRQVRAT